MVKDDRKKFKNTQRNNIWAMGLDQKLKEQAINLTGYADQYHYSYMWTWLGLPIIQMPPDIIVLQEIIWQQKPQVIIETGVARGGSVIFYSSMLQLLGEGQVIAVDIDIRPHNREAIESHPFFKRISLIEGSSIDPTVVAQVRALIPPKARVMVILDSNHTHEHVLEELKGYAPLVSVGQYLVVADTVVEDLPLQEHRLREWGPGNNPKTALREFLKENMDFEIDADIDGKLILSSSPGGYLKRVKKINQKKRKPVSHSLDPSASLD